MIFWPRRSHQRRRWDPFYIVVYTYLCSIFRALLHIYMYFVLPMLPASGQAVVSGVVPSPPRYVPSDLIAQRVQHFHCS